MAELTPVERRREVVSLVVACESGLDATVSRQKIAAEYELTVKSIEKIE